MENNKEVPPCELYKYKTKKATHYVGKSGKEYLMEDFTNHGKGIPFRGLKDLPADDYPYVRKYVEDYLFTICKNCNCKHKD